MSSIIEFTHACWATQGTRERQEDSSLVWRPGTASGGEERSQPILAVLADGMGGHVSGETASRLACDGYVQVFSAEYSDLAQRMEESLTASNEALTGAIRDNGALKGMGSTLIAGYLDEEGLRWVSVGDSALLLYRNGTLRQLNADHSVGAMLDKQVDAGLIEPTIAKNDPRRRALRSALTGGAIALRDCEFNAYPLEAFDWVILATDGLEALSGDEIASVIHEHEHAAADVVAESLIDAVEQKREQHQDNATVIVLRVTKRPELHAQPTELADDAQHDPDTAKTVLIDPPSQRNAGSDLTQAAAQPDCTAQKEPHRKSWWPRMKLLLLAAALPGAIAVFGLCHRNSLEVESATAHKEAQAPAVDRQAEFAPLTDQSPEKR